MTTAIPRSQRTLILALLCVASFAVVFNNLIITPILPDISEDLGVRVAVAGLLVIFRETWQAVVFRWWWPGWPR